MGICFSKCLGRTRLSSSNSANIEDIHTKIIIGECLEIPQNCLVTTEATSPVLKITQIEPCCLVEHSDFPFPLQLKLLSKDEAPVEMEFWKNGHLRSFPFLKNVYWAWRQEEHWFFVEDYCSEGLPIEDLEFQSIDKNDSEIFAFMLADALNHLHSSSLVHGAVLPTSLYYHSPTRSLKLGNFAHLQRIPRDGNRCTQAVPTCSDPNDGYFEEIDWYAFGKLLQEWNIYPQLAGKLISHELGHGPSAYTQIKHQLETKKTRNKD